ncbi:MAG: NAD(P)H-hydrate epimerase [Chloroflexi bacterium]|nr:NAD(P)H-hydrate epimerase [Chloroflexota bacterium]
MQRFEFNPIIKFFSTVEGVKVPALTEQQMREVDRIAVDEFNLGILQMMENAGRNLSMMIIEMLQDKPGEITILAGPGGNGGGGICSARHLRNHGYKVNLILSKDTKAYLGAAKTQLTITQKAGLIPTPIIQAQKTISKSQIIIDALIGYSLKDAPYGNIAHLIEITNRYSTRVLALDIPSGMDSTSGNAPGSVIVAERTLTLALPKLGLNNPTAGELYLADIGIPPEVYHSIGIKFDPFFGNQYNLRILRIPDESTD